MRLRSFALLPVLAASLAAIHCGGATSPATTQDGGSAPGPGGAAGDGGLLPDGAPAPRANPDAVGATTSSKVDLLLVVDNSAAMGDKGKLLAASVGTLLRRLVVAGDVHVAVISTSLGTFGGDVCATSGSQNTLAHLSTSGPGAAPVASAAQGFLAYGGVGGSNDVDALVADTAKLVEGVGESGCGLEAQLESAYRFLVQP